MTDGWYLRTQDETFGPEPQAKLVEWARMGRIQPGQEISNDNLTWRKVEDVPFLDMRFSIDIGDGNPRGPFNKVAADALLASGRLPKTAFVVEVREPFVTEPVAAEPPAVATKLAAKPPEPAVEVVPKPEPEVRVVEKEVVKEVRVEVPVEKIVEKIVEVPVEKRVEVPVEKIVEKIVVDETRVKELEGLLAEERRHTADLQGRLDTTSKNAADAAKLALDRENKFVEQVQKLEDELRRLPQAASEVADIQAAVYGIITGESEELNQILEQEKREFEEVKKRYTERADRLQERRRELLRRSGSNIEEMTRKALIARPEDPRTVQLRKDLDEARRAQDRMRIDYEDRLKTMSEQLKVKSSDELRMSAKMKDVTQLSQEVQALRERLQLREKELLAEKQRNEELVKQQATKQQALLTRLAALESPSIGNTASLSTNQSREAKQIKLPGWMHFK